MSGRSLFSDEELYEALQKIADVVKSAENHQIEAIMTKRPIDLVLVEISKDNSSEVELIKSVKHQFPNTVIIVIDGEEDREVISQTFSYGAKDAFRKPYKRALIVERVQALLSRVS